MKILITGATGFLGKRLTAFFMNSGNNNVFTLSKSGSTFYTVDIVSDVPVFDLVFDLVIHAAGKAHSVPSTDEQSKEFYKCNVEGTNNLLKALEKFPPKNLVFISTVAVYGLNDGINIDETFPLLATDPYGRSKVEAESMIRDWCRHFKTNCLILRLPLLVGNNAPGNLGNMVTAIKKGYYFNVSTGGAKKSMVMVSDVPEIIKQSIGRNGVFNLTDGYHPSFKELSNHIAEQLRRKVYSLPYLVIKIAARIGDILGRNAPINSSKLRKVTSTLIFDDTKARKELGWQPKQVLKSFIIEYSSSE